MRKAAPRKVVPHAPDTKYLRDKYPEDEVIQAYADVIERNLGIWEAIKQFEKAGMDMRGAKLVRWDVSTHAEPREAVRHTINLDLVNVEVSKRVRT